MGHTTRIEFRTEEDGKDFRVPAGALWKSEIGQMFRIAFS
jgi:hypothetical protein